jgi:multidrug efflux pump subunit AcrA (membrane-fusion protein)
MSSDSNSEKQPSNHRFINPVEKLLSARSHADRRVIVFIVLIIALIIGGGYYLLRTVIDHNDGFTLSGTIEATEVHLGSETGGIVDRLNVAEGDHVESGAVVAVVHGDYVRTPIDGTVLERVSEPGEVIPAYSTIVTISDLNSLTLTVYAPEDRYGHIVLGEACTITVDSFPGTSFKGIVSHIAEKAEFTPRNVQTTDNRKSTVFAIKLKLEPSNGLLKPGMPADVHFQYIK